MKAEGRHLGPEMAQRQYASALDRLATAGFVLVAGLFFIYLSGLLPAWVPPESIAANWHVPAARLHGLLEVPAGWSFLKDGAWFLRGDLLSYASLVLLSFVPFICLLVAAWAFSRQHVHAYTLIALLQAFVLLLAASGIF